MNYILTIPHGRRKMKAGRLCLLLALTVLLYLMIAWKLGASAQAILMARP